MAVMPAHIHTFPFLRLTCQLPPLLAVRPPDTAGWEGKRFKELHREIKNQILLSFVLATEWMFVAWLPACRTLEVDGG